MAKKPRKGRVHREEKAYRGYIYTLHACDWQVMRQMNCHSGGYRFVYNKMLGDINTEYIAHTEGKGDKPDVSPTGMRLRWQALRNNEDYSWLKELASHTIRESAYDLGQAWANFFAGRAEKPKKKEYRGKRRRTSFTMRDNFRIEKSERNGRKLVVRLPKIGWVVLTRRGGTPYPDGIPKEITCKFVNGKWMAVIQYEIEPPPTTRNGHALGLDRGCGQHGTAMVEEEDVEIVDDKAQVIAEKIATKLHEYLHNKQKKHPNQEKDERAIKRHQRKAKRQTKGSKRWRDTQDMIARGRKRIANRVKDQNHKLSRWIAGLVEIVCVEDLKPKNMTASARGTMENPGKNVKQKAGLNAAILVMAWAMLLRMLEYKCTTVIPVPAPYTSQRCSRCKHVDKANRPLQAVFRCVKCHHADHADLNAAINILLLGLELTHADRSANPPGLIADHMKRE